MVPSQDLAIADAVSYIRRIESGKYPHVTVPMRQEGKCSFLDEGKTVRRFDRWLLGTPSGTISVDPLILDPRFFLAQPDMRCSVLSRPQVPARIR